MPARCWPLPVLAAAAVLALAPLSPAEDKKDDKPKPKVESDAIQFESADGVELIGTHYKAVMTGEDKIVSAKAEGDAPVVIMLHPFLGDPNAKEYDGLAVLLAARGFHVLRFDFRGHGKSTVIAKHFWDSSLFPENTKVFSALARMKPPPLQLENAQVKKSPGYWPVMVNDILAARIAVDKLNDAGKLNAASVYLLAVGDSAPLAMMYLAAEHTRPQKPTEAQAQFIRALPILGVDTRDSAARDVAAAIFVAPAYTATITDKHLTSWSKTFSDLRTTTHVLCVHGDGDAAGKKFSNSLVNEILIPKPQPKSNLTPLKYTLTREIKGSKNVGVDLLNPKNAPDTETEILKYLTAVEKDRTQKPKVVNRNYKDAPYLAPTLNGFPGVAVR